MPNFSDIKTMDMNTLSSISTANLEKAYSNAQIGAATSALKGALEVQEVIQMELMQMMKELSPHLGQNIDITA